MKFALGKYFISCKPNTANYSAESYYLLTRLIFLEITFQVINFHVDLFSRIKILIISRIYFCGFQAVVRKQTFAKSIKMS